MCSGCLKKHFSNWDNLVFIFKGYSLQKQGYDVIIGTTCSYGKRKIIMKMKFYYFLILDLLK
jgi:hypothetical protein